MPRDTPAQTFKVAFVLCIVCSLLVSATAVTLRPRQKENRQRFVNTNILIAAGLHRPGMTAEEIDRIFKERFVERIIHLDPIATDDDRPAGMFLTPEDYARFGLPDRLAEYDQGKASRDPQMSDRIPGPQDVAAIRRRERFSLVYLVRAADGDEVEQIVLPVRGYGLWSTLWGFIAVDVPSLRESPEVAEVRGLTFYEHAETPGLGGEVDNPQWKAQWVGKRLFDQEWNVELRVARGTVDPPNPYRVDGLAGATITANGVTNMLQFWLGDLGFRPFLRNLHEDPQMLDEMLDPERFQTQEGGNGG